jgi:signal transduction histidine kinase
MQVAPLPPNEALRLKNLLSYNILDTEDDKEFNNLVELAAQVCNCKYALITFIDKERQWFKAKRNVNVSETPRDISFCAHTILQDKVMVIKDAKKDKRFFDNPLVTGKHKISFYASAPITSTAGYRIGSVSAMDKKAKTVFSPVQKKTLQIIAHHVALLLELRKKNKLIAEQTEAQAAEEKIIFQKTLTGQDEENFFVANELHENFAQTLAATKLYLDFAEQSKESGAAFIKKSKTTILQIIKEIVSLSRSMLPSTFENANYMEFIQEMLTEYGQLHHKEIAFWHEGRINCYTSKIGLTLFRVIQYQLKNANNSGAKKISITIKTNKAIHVTFVDDGKKPGCIRIRK